MTQRYAQLLPIIAKAKPKTIVEVGTWNGLRAIEMCTEALKHQEKVHYTGFDLFEDANEETDARELNVKRSTDMATVLSRLTDFQKDNAGFTFDIHKGDTRETLGEGKYDLAFIDGGHSVETIQSDYEALKDSKVIVFDDYYTPENGHPDVSKYGCNSLVDALKDATFLPQTDPVRGGGGVRMALIPRRAWPGKVNLKIKTQNCANEEEIHANITYSVPKIKKWVAECKVHHETAIIVSGGPSMNEHLESIRKEEGYLVCVKHSHDPLIEAGIIPDACMLLDPRNHVQDFIENPHSEITYFVASMCHQTTLDRLIERDAKIIGYNAQVGSSEVKALHPFGEHILIGGGSTSATRGISVLYAMGFRKFKLYGYDSCYYTEPDFTVKTKIGNQKYVTVEVGGKTFWSDLELIAQAQDFDTLMKTGKDLDLEVFGNGMIPHIWAIGKKNFPEFRDVMNG